MITFLSTVIVVLLIIIFYLSRKLYQVVKSLSDINNMVQKFHFTTIEKNSKESKIIQTNNMLNLIVGLKNGEEWAIDAYKKISGEK